MMYELGTGVIDNIIDVLRSVFSLTAKVVGNDGTAVVILQLFFLLSTSYSVSLLTQKKNDKIIFSGVVFVFLITQWMMITLLSFCDFSTDYYGFYKNTYLSLYNFFFLLLLLLNLGFSGLPKMQSIRN